MSIHPICYDPIAASYDRRFSNEEDSNIAARLLALSSELGAARILEVGCGTGRWLAEFDPGQTVPVGLDLSEGMLAQARRVRLGLRLVQGDASALPFESAAFDLIYCINALHHFTHPQAFIAAAYRLLRPGGALAVVGMDASLHQEADWYIYRYFPETYEVDLARYPSSGTILDWMAQAGFQGAEWGVAECIRASKKGYEVLEDPFLEKNSTSQLILLSQEQYQSGLERIRLSLIDAEATGEQIIFPVNIRLHILIGHVPGE